MRTPEEFRKYGLTRKDDKEIMAIIDVLKELYKNGKAINAIFTTKESTLNSFAQLNSLFKKEGLNEIDYRNIDYKDCTHPYTQNIITKTNPDLQVIWYLQR